MGFRQVFKTLISIIPSRCGAKEDIEGVINGGEVPCVNMQDRWINRVVLEIESNSFFFNDFIFGVWQDAVPQCTKSSIADFGANVMAFDAADLGVLMPKSGKSYN